MTDEGSDAWHALQQRQLARLELPGRARRASVARHCRAWLVRGRQVDTNPSPSPNVLSSSHLRPQLISRPT